MGTGTPDRRHTLQGSEQRGTHMLHKLYYSVYCELACNGLFSDRLGSRGSSRCHQSPPSSPSGISSATPRCSETAGAIALTGQHDWCRCSAFCLWTVRIVHTIYCCCWYRFNGGIVMQRRFFALQDAVVHALYREERAISPTNLVAAVWKVAGVSSNTMEDAHVSWLAFANSLDSIILDPKDRSKCRFEALEGAVEGREITLARYLFGLTVWSTVTCSHCGHRSQTSETCFDLQVALPEPGSEQSPSMTAEPPQSRRHDDNVVETPTTPRPSVRGGLSPRCTPMHDVDSSSSVGTDGLVKPTSCPASQGTVAHACCSCNLWSMNHLPSAWFVGGSMLTSAEPSGDIPSTTASEDADMNGSVHKQTPPAGR